MTDNSTQPVNAPGKRRRVVILVENLPVPFDRRVWMEAQTLQTNGYEVSVICPKGKGYEKGHEILNGVYIYRYALPVEARRLFTYALEYSWALLMSFLLLLRIRFSRGFDVIQACNPPDLLFLAAAPFKLFGSRFIFDHHDLMPELLVSKYGEGKMFAYDCMLAMERATFAMADVSIATNNSYRNVAITRGKMPPEDVFVVRSAPRLSWIIPAATPQTREPIVGYVGVMGDQEGIDLLLEAARHIVHTLGRKEVRFVLVGDGGARSDLEQLARDLDLAEHVEFTGRVSDERLKQALSSAAVLVNPDRPSELNDKSTMNKIVEYMAMQKPVVQFDCTEGRFSAQDASLYAKPGDCVDFAEKILSLIDDPARADAIAAYGRKRYEEELCWEHQEPKLLAAYARALA